MCRLVVLLTVLVIIYNAAATAAIPADDVVPEEVLPQAKAGTTGYKWVAVPSSINAHGKCASTSEDWASSTLDFATATTITAYCQNQAEQTGRQHVSLSPGSLPTKCITAASCDELSSEPTYNWWSFVYLQNCDASTAPANGEVGTCTDDLEVGGECQPTCNDGYTVSGTSACNKECSGSTCSTVYNPATCDPDGTWTQDSTTTKCKWSSTNWSKTTVSSLAECKEYAAGKTYMSYCSDNSKCYASDSCDKKTNTGNNWVTYTYG